MLKPMETRMEAALKGSRAMPLSDRPPTTPTSMLPIDSDAHTMLWKLQSNGMGSME